MESAPPVPPDQATSPGHSPGYYFLMVGCWILFGLSQFRGCDTARRLDRIEQQNRELKAILERGSRPVELRPERR